MTVFVKAAVLVATSTVLLGCDRSGYESTPVVLKNDFGSVSCQLYTIERVMWDHALTHPDTLTKAQADALCVAEGEKRQAEYKASLKKKKSESGNGFLGFLKRETPDA